MPESDASCAPLFRLPHSAPDATTRTADDLQINYFFSPATPLNVMLSLSPPFDELPIALELYGWILSIECTVLRRVTRLPFEGRSFSCRLPCATNPQQTLSPSPTPSPTCDPPRRRHHLSPTQAHLSAPLFLSRRFATRRCRPNPRHPPLRSPPRRTRLGPLTPPPHHQPCIAAHTRFLRPLKWFGNILDSVRPSLLARKM